MKKETPRHGERNIWKIVSIVFIAVFIMIIAVGVIGLRARPQFEQPTEVQVGSAQELVAADLQANGDSIDNYEVSVTDRMIGIVGMHCPMDGHGSGMRRMECMEEDVMVHNNIQVALRGNSTAYLYIIDADSGKIAMKSFTEWLDE